MTNPRQPYDAARIVASQLADAPTEALVAELSHRTKGVPPAYDRYALNTLVEMLNDMGYGPIADRILACRIGGYDRPLRSLDTRLPSPSPYIVPPRPSCRCYLCRLGALRGDADVE